MNMSITISSCFRIMVLHRLYKLQETEDDLRSLVEEVFSSHDIDYDGDIELEHCFYIDTGSQGNVKANLVSVRSVPMISSPCE